MVLQSVADETGVEKQERRSSEDEEKSHRELDETYLCVPMHMLC